VLVALKSWPFDSRAVHGNLSGEYNLCTKELHERISFTTTINWWFWARALPAERTREGDRAAGILARYAGVLSD
jgi:hypothetical protein